MKKVILGSALIVGGILLCTLSLLIIESDATSGLITSFPFIGIALFIIGCILGIRGLYDNDSSR